MARTAYIVSRLRQALIHSNWEAVEIALNEAKRVRAEIPDLTAEYRSRGRSAYSLSSSTANNHIKLLKRADSIGHAVSRYLATTTTAESPFSGLDPVAIKEVSQIQELFLSSV